ncbi:histone H4-K16 acetylation [Branchiostoma belcheri]|nr:histone H4-K16 acetylation [Branchiostoma belcheri]
MNQWRPPSSLVENITSTTTVETQDKLAWSALQNYDPAIRSPWEGIEPGQTQLVAVVLARWLHWEGRLMLASMGKIFGSEKKRLRWPGGLVEEVVALAEVPARPRVRSPDGRREIRSAGGPGPRELPGREEGPAAPCGWCAEYRDFVPCRQQHILLNCYKKLCEYVACTSSGRSLLSANGASSSVLTSLQEGLMLPCDSPVPDRELTMLSGRGTTGPPVHTQERTVRGRGSHRVHRRWRRGGRGRGSRGGLGRGGFHHQRRSIISITPHGNRWRQRGVATRGTRHQPISREIRNLAGWGSFHQLELDDKQEETEVEDNVSVASNPPPDKRSCRCEGVKILDSESDFFARGVKEAVDIRAHRPTLNRDGGRHKLSGTYDPLLRSRVSDVTFHE